MSQRLRIMLVPAAVLGLWYPPAWALDLSPLLDTCPQHDPVYPQMRSDAELRHNGMPVQDIPCSVPIAQRLRSQHTDELIVGRGLRALFYMLGSTFGEPLTAREDFGPLADEIAFARATPLTGEEIIANPDPSVFYPDTLGRSQPCIIP